MIAPSPVTSLALTRVSSDRPKAGVRYPIPPPSVSPATPVSPNVPPGIASPVALAGRVDVFPQCASSSARHRAVLRIDRDVPHQAEIHDEAPVPHAMPGHAVPTAAYR